MTQPRLRALNEQASQANVAAGPDHPVESSAKRLARTALRPSINAAAVVEAYNKTVQSPEGHAAMHAALADEMRLVADGDLRRAEEMLCGQAHALEAIFRSMAERAARQTNMKLCEDWLRMALKAQNQCRMTLETLATIKNPPVVYARQANINNGVVNNASRLEPAPVTAPAHTHARNSATLKTELLESSDGERLDDRSAGATGSLDPYVEALGAINRTPNRRGQGQRRTQRVQGRAVAATAQTEEGTE